MLKFIIVGIVTLIASSLIVVIINGGILYRTEFKPIFKQIIEKLKSGKKEEQNQLSE